VGIGNPGGHLRGDPRGQAESLHLTVRFDGLGQGQRQEQVLLLLVVWSGRHTLTMQLCHAHHTILILTLHPLLVGGEVTQFGAIEGHVHRGSWQFGYLKGAQGGVIRLVEGVLGRSYVGASASRGRLEGGGVRVGREVAFGGGGEGFVLSGAGMPVLGERLLDYSK